MHVRFRLVAPASKTRDLSIPLPIVVGRGPEAGLRLPQQSVSRRHCELFETNGIVFVRDLGSTNGTLIGDRRVSGSDAIAVLSGNEIQVGDVRFRVEFEPVAAQRQSAAAAVDTPGIPEPTVTAAVDDAADVDFSDVDIPDLPVSEEPPPLTLDAEPPRLPVAGNTAAEPPPTFDAGTVPATDAIAFPGAAAEVEESPAGFDFLATDSMPAKRDDGNLDDFLKGLQ